MATQIHPTAIVSPQAELGEGVTVGPYCIIEDGAVIGEGTWLESHVTVRAGTTIGRFNRIFAYASIGGEPQDWTYRGEPTKLIIGERNIIREFVTFHRGSVKGGGVTRVGSEGMYMAYVHIAHDCQVGDHVVLANNATLSGHVIIEDWASMSGLSAVHQFARLGAHCFVAALSGVSQDAPPYCLVSGPRAELYGLNAVGLKRRGFSVEAIAALKQAYRILFRGHGGLSDNLAEVEEKLGQFAEVRHLVGFIRTSERGVIH